MKTLVIDYGMGNLGSACRALEECGATVTVSSDPDDVGQADRLVLPGVGSFAEGMTNLARQGWPARLAEVAADGRTPLIGICLGMQLLATKGWEGGECAGLGLVPGEVKRLQAPSPEVRIPHVGWNEVRHVDGEPLFDGIPSGTDYYFVHSYHFLPARPEHAVATTPYCGQFVAAVRSGPVCGVQFHPEKSARMGLRLLRNFLERA